MKLKKNLTALVVSFVLMMSGMIMPSMPAEAASTATAKNYETGIKLKWSSVSGVAGYRIYRGDKLVKNIQNTTTLSYSDKSVTNGTTYKYKVVPYTKSNTKKTAMKATIYRLSQPSISSISSPSAGKITVKYSKNSKASGYQIQYATSSSFSSAKTINVSTYTTTTKSITGLKGGTKYYVRVRSVKTLNGVKYKSSWSDYAVKTAKKASTSGTTGTAGGTVYVTPTGTHYHSRICGRGNFTQSTLEAAKARGLTPCSKCY